MGASARPKTLGSPKRKPSRGDLQPRSNFGPGLHERHNRPSQRRGRESCQHPGKYRPPELLDALSRKQRASSCCAEFHIIDFPFVFAAPAFGACQVAIPKFSPQSFCETVERERVSQSVLVPTMINMLTQFDKLGNYDLTSLETLAYGGSPMAPRAHPPDKRGLAQSQIASRLRTERNRLSYRPGGPRAH